MEHPPARGATRAHWVCVDDTVWALRAVRAAADKALIDRQLTVLPVRLSGQAKPLINSAPRCYPPPHTVAAAATTPHHLARNHMAPAPARCEPIPASPLLPEPSICPAWPSAAPAPARCEPLSAFPLLPGQSRLRTCPWNIRRRVEHRGAHQGRFHSPHRFSEARVRRKGPGAHGPTSPNPYDTENGPVAYARHITSPVTALVGAAERQQVGTGGGSTYRQEQARQARTSADAIRNKWQTQAGTSGSRSRRQQARTSAGAIRDR